MRVHLVDGTYELFRAWFGAPKASAPDGAEVGAARTLARQLLKHVREQEITHLGVAFDHVIESFRNELFAGYKTGAGLEPELYAQFELAEDVTRALGFVTWPMVAFEADDALATAATICAKDARVTQVCLMTPDKDLAQCVSGTRVVTQWKERVLDADGVRARFGVAPASIPDYLALVGDEADGIPGLPGFGARTAATLLAAYEHLEAIPAESSVWRVELRGAAKLAHTLVERRDDALLYRRLATLRTDAPLAEDVDALEWRGAERAALEAVCARLGDPKLLERVTRWRA
ncbi:MAG: flap endonuclease [Planctomycetes bacterium]|nr:flap endonuclease [Planctomycetota bacterium]